MLTDPCKLIGTIEELRGEISRRTHPISLEIDAIKEQWDGLGRAGGQRADHAAQLMARLRPALHDLARFYTAVEAQITAMVADPFERK